jgi:microcystin-dependent protein
MLHKKQLNTAVSLTVALALLLVVSASAAPLEQSGQPPEPPTTITYQGHLLDDSNNPVADNTYSMKFRLYDDDDPVAGNLLWESAIHSVDTLDGYFSVLLGSGSDPSLTADVLRTNTFLEIEVEAETLAPLYEFASVPFALAAAESGPFVGEIKMFAGDFAPSGWAFCDGQLLNISDYPDLHSLIGDTYGGDGVTTFALPDLRSRIPMHKGQGPGLTDRPQGEMGGEEAVQLTEAQMPQHTHSLQAQDDAASVSTPGGNYLAQRGRPDIYDSDSDKLVQMGVDAIGATGGSQPHNNMQPYLVLNFIIALEGSVPSQ